MLLSTVPQPLVITNPGLTSSGQELITRTLLVQRLQRCMPQLTSWTVRKAERYGIVLPDKTGRCAGHAVHYYDPARIPELLRQLMPPDCWTAGTLVMHSEFGAGRIVAADPVDLTRRVVLFFASAVPITVSIHELRRLLSSTALAQRIGVDRKSFAKGAAKRGIDPDYAGTRNFYDEARVDSIRQQWSSPQAANAVQAGWFVLDTQDDVARVEYIHPNGHVGLRSVADGRLTETSNTSTSCLRRLVSTRELARRERCRVTS